MAATTKENKQKEEDLFKALAVLRKYGGSIDSYCNDQRSLNDVINAIVDLIEHLP